MEEAGWREGIVSLSLQTEVWPFVLVFIQLGSLSVCFSIFFQIAIEEIGSSCGNSVCL